MTVPMGLWLWHRLSADFGLGSQGRAVSAREATTVWLLLVMLVVTLFLLG